MDLSFTARRGHDEGDIGKICAALVNEKSFANLAKHINLGEFIYLSIAEKNNGGRAKESILSDAFEAVMGAIYFESGPEAAQNIRERLLEIFIPI